MTEQTRLQRLAEYYDTHDTSTELERAELVDEPVDPHPTQLIRRWIEERRTVEESSLEDRIRRLEHLVQRGAGSDS